MIIKFKIFESSKSDNQKNYLKKKFQIGDIVIADLEKNNHPFFFDNEKLVITHIIWEYDTAGFTDYPFYNGSIAEAGYIEFKYLNTQLKNPDMNDDPTDSGGWRMLMYCKKIGHMTEEEMSIYFDSKKFGL